MELNKIYECVNLYCGDEGGAIICSLNDYNLIIKLVKFNNLFLIELDIMSRLRHQNIISILDFGIFKFINDKQIKKTKLDIIDEDLYFGFVMEKAYKDLYDYKPSSKQEVLNIIDQMLNSVSFLHSNNIIHGDIKPDNFLVCKYEDKIVTKLIDFGESVYAPSGKTSVPFYGSLGYRSLELIYNYKIKDYTEDYWALGCTIYYIVTRKDPYRESPIFSNNYKETFAYMRQREIDDIIEKEFTKYGYTELIDITKKLLSLRNRGEVKLENKTLGYNLNIYNKNNNNTDIDIKSTINILLNLDYKIGYDILLKILQFYISNRENGIDIYKFYIKEEKMNDFNLIKLYNVLDNCNGIINNYSLYDTPFRNIEKIKSLEDYEFIFKYYLKI